MLRTALDRCPCGRPWTHDPDANTAEGAALVRFATEMVRAYGPVLRLQAVGDGQTYLVARYYLARHRFAGFEAPGLGFPRLGSDDYLLFPEIPAICCARCGLTSHHPEDARHRFCGHCHVFHEG